MYLEMRHHKGHVELWLREGQHMHHKSTVHEGDTVKIESFLDTHGRTTVSVGHKDFFFAEAKGAPGVPSAPKSI